MTEMLAEAVTDEVARVDPAEELQASEARYRLLAENVSDLICTLDLELRLGYVSPSIERMLGWRADQAEGHRLGTVLPAEGVKALKAELAAELAREGRPGVDAHRSRTFDLELRSRDDRIVFVEAKTTFLRDLAGRPSGVLAVVRDLTAWREAQEALRRSEERSRQRQKLEAIGKLAGGIAHDFNNMLTVILGNAGLLRLRLGDDAPGAREAEEIRRAAERAAALTRQLLAFSRKQVLTPQIVDLNRVVAETEGMLRRLIGEDVELVTRLGADLGRVEADRGQLEQVLMNLAVNARDAMPGGGRLTIETAMVARPPAELERDAELRGPCVVLRVSDTGVGIRPEDEERIFEPFFTTKEVGKGTGLGLAMVYGIVRQSGGAVRVESEPHHGATFEVYLPSTERPAEPAPAPAPAPLAAGAGTVLVVEDEEGVRSLVRRTLEGSGYRVLEAGDGVDALALAGDHRGSIDLLLTDVVMPGMSGVQLAEAAAERLPETRVLFMSGHSADALAHHGRRLRGAELIEKPFAPAALVERVRQVLDRPHGEPRRTT